MQSNASLCLATVGVNSMGNPNVKLALCGSSYNITKWNVQSSTADAASGIKIISLSSKYSGKCLDIQRNDYEMELFGCQDTKTQIFTFDAASSTTGSVIGVAARSDQAVAVC